MLQLKESATSYSFELRKSLDVLLNLSSLRAGDRTAAFLGVLIRSTSNILEFPNEFGTKRFIILPVLDSPASVASDLFCIELLEEDVFDDDSVDLLGRRLTIQFDARLHRAHRSKSNFCVVHPHESHFLLTFAFPIISLSLSEKLGRNLRKNKNVYIVSNG